MSIGNAIQIADFRITIGAAVFYRAANRHRIRIAQTKLDTTPEVETRPRLMRSIPTTP